MNDIDKRMMAVLSECPDIPTRVLNISQAFFQFQCSRSVSDRQNYLRAMKLAAIDLIRAIDDEALKHAIPDQQWDAVQCDKPGGGV